MRQKIIKTGRLEIYPINRRHLGFLLKIWNDPELMKYAGFARNWSYPQVEKWYERYKKRLVKYGNTETQFVVRLERKIIGESGLGRLKAGWSCKNYKTPKNKTVLMADIKLLKPFWNKNYGTEAMQAIVRYVFTKTLADVFLVPPHINNEAAIRVYEKSGFKKTSGCCFRFHHLYKMSKKDYVHLKGRK